MYFPETASMDEFTKYLLKIERETMSFLQSIKEDPKQNDLLFDGECRKQFMHSVSAR